MESAAVAQSGVQTSVEQDKRRKKIKTHRDARTGWMFMAPFFAAFVLVFLIPIVVAIFSSFTRTVTSGGGAYGGGETATQFVGLENYQMVISSEDFWLGIGRVLGYTAFQVPIMTLAALALALVLDSYLTKHVTAYRLGFFLPYAIPGVIAATIWLYLYTPELSPIVSLLSKLGINVDFFNHNIILASMANITTWTFTGYNMLIFLAALQAIPKELEEAAYIDGATGFQVITKIKIPMVRGAALLSVLLSIVGTIQLFNEPQIMATSQSWMGASFTPMMMAYNTMMGEISPSGDGPASAISIVMALIAGVLALVYAIVERKTSK